ncbi:hypothetical protein SKAU_G00219160 [Synaphobranchus kaupii]|uniref:Uncharacterized protein n=1 Tax=Synaphobranchus kaupii TaxID=118154 RepID=A0A9Q1IVB7_SYNKA|nr:hypothetical protein SKAU_G00219160 [Synaphobranchus kaupii]
MRQLPYFSSRDRSHGPGEGQPIPPLFRRFHREGSQPERRTATPLSFFSEGNRFIRKSSRWRNYRLGLGIGTAASDGPALLRTGGRCGPRRPGPGPEVLRRPIGSAPLL